MSTSNELKSAINLTELHGTHTFRGTAHVPH